MVLLAIMQSSGLVISSWWRRTLGETRTRILFLYLLLMVGFTAVAVPIFRMFLFAEVDARVRADLINEMEEFRIAYETWESTPDQSVTDFTNFVDEFLEQQVPEDDNFLIALLDNQFYRSNPAALPNFLQPGSRLADQWLNLSTQAQGEQAIAASSVGSVIYLAQSLRLEGEIRGVFVAVHLTAGERQEAISSVFIFIKVALGVVTVSFALAWLITGQLLAPVRTLAQTARSISESDLDQRLPVEGHGELANLSCTFNAMMNRIQTAFVSQQNFINDAGHELRTPITIIRGHLELLDEDPVEQQQTLDLVLDELDRMSRFVNDMILLAKAERADFLLLETIEVRSFTEEIFVKAQTLADRNWQMKVEGVGQMVGDRQRLTGAIINLAQNATQHTQAHDLVELGIAMSHHDVRFWVRDTGEGIAPADQQRIFERFARAANSYRRSEGAGLGLAIVRAIAEAHGGRIELASQLDVGSTFTLVLPLEPPQEKLRP